MTAYARSGVPGGRHRLRLRLIGPARRRRRNATHRRIAFTRGRCGRPCAILVDEIGPSSSSADAPAPRQPAAHPRRRAFDPQVSLIAACRSVFPDVRSILFVGRGEVRAHPVRPGRALPRQRGPTPPAPRARAASSTSRRAGSASRGSRSWSAARSPARLPRRRSPPGAPCLPAPTSCTPSRRATRLEEICDGLCRGLAQNIADTLLGGEKLERRRSLPAACALNEAVRGHLEQILGVPL